MILNGGMYSAIGREVMGIQNNNKKNHDIMLLWRGHSLPTCLGTRSSRKIETIGAGLYDIVTSPIRPKERGNEMPSLHKKARTEERVSAYHSIIPPD